MRVVCVALLAAAVVSLPGVAQGQSFGLGGRLSMVRTDVDADTEAERFMGGHIRARLSPRTAVELSVDLRTTTNEALTERIRQYPVQASLLLYPLRTAFSPYLLGGGGWYTTRLETLVDDEAISTQSNREFGWHGGFGAELRLGSHAGAHADYRYTHLAYGDDDDDGGDEGALGKLMPSYRGSMWTAGLTIYF